MRIARLAFFVSLLSTLVIPPRARAERPLIVLVPGFLNSLSTTPDFADAITNTIHARGLEVVTVDTLSAVGTVQENGTRLDRFLGDLSTTHPGRSMILLAHSAGGLYTLEALTRHPQLPVKTLVSLATPFRGVEFVDRLQAGIPGLEALVGFMRLESLRQFASNRIASVLERFRVPPQLRVVSLAGYQAPCHLLGCAQSENLSWVLSVAQSFMTHPSDGVVTVGSALGEGLELKRTNGIRLEIEHWSDVIIPLEHWEIVQDAENFRLLGVANPGHIRRAQVQLFNTILNRLGPEISGIAP